MSKEMRATILNDKILIKPVNSYIFTKYNIKKNVHYIYLKDL